MELTQRLKSFLDKDGRLTAMPVKRKMKNYALLYMASKLEPGRRYTEKELGQAISAYTAFNDPATLRRELYDNRFIDREANGSAYWMENPQPTPEDLGLEE